MNLRTTFVLMLLFMALGSIAFFDPFRWEAKERESGEKRVLHLGKIVREIILRNGDRVVHLECAVAAGCALDGAAEWKVTEPVKDKGDSSAIATLANALANLRYIEKVDFEGGIDPKEFGLGEGKPVVEVKGSEGSFTLETGSATPVGPNVYLRLNGDPKSLYIVASYFPEMLDKEAFHWQNKRLFPEATAESVKEISWKSKEAFRAKKDQGKWSLEAPVKAPGNFIMLEGLSSTLVYASAKALAEKKPTGSPSLHIEFTGGKLDLYPKSGAAKGSRDLVAVAGGRSFVVEGTPFERFRKPLLEYRERRVFPDLDPVQEMELVFPRSGQRIKLKKTGEWSVDGEKPPEALSFPRIERLADALVSVEASAFLEPSNPAARELKNRKPDVEVHLPGGRHARFLVSGRKAVVTDGPRAGEAMAVNGPFLELLPIRLEDLFASHDKLAPEPKKETDGHHDSHDLGHAR